jgi:hypothetical protein
MFALMPDVHVLDAEEDLLLPITLTRVPARSPALSSASGIPLLTDPQHRRICKCMRLGPNSSTRKRVSGPIMASRAPLRSHAVSLWVWRRFDARRKLASLTCPEAPASDRLAEAAGCFCCRNGHVSAGCRAAVELAELVQVKADEETWPCRHASHAAREVFQVQG